MTPGGKVGHRAFAAVGYMSNDAETQSAAPLRSAVDARNFLRRNGHGPVGRLSVALGQAISGFRLLSTGSGSRGKKKGRLPDGSGPQRDMTPPRHTQ